MKQFSKLKFDPHNGRVYFEGGCDEVRDVCEAMCCRRVFCVDLTEEESRSGLYEYDTLCNSNSEICKDSCLSCLNRRHILSKKPDGSCVYLDQANMCSIYEKRPLACREFQCSSGWVVTDVLPTEKRNKILSNAMKEGLKKDMKFAPNEAFRVKSIFYSPEKKEAVFVMEALNRCKYLPVTHSFSCPEANDEMLLFIYKSFDGERTLGEIKENAVRKFGPALSENVFGDIMTVFLRSGVIVFRYGSRLCGEAGTHE